MFKTILMTAAVAVVITAAAAPAHALVSLNGTGENGIYPNGRELNGRELNGRELNGIYPNGTSMEGMPTGVATFVIDGIELPARVR